MKRMMIFLTVMITMTFACNTKSTNETGQHCYTHYENKDSVKVSLTMNGNLVKGEMKYQIFEKDRNNGTLQGVLSGDTIFAQYEFESEGVTSTRDVIFLKKGSTLVEGLGQMDALGIRFASRRDLKFDGIKLQETSCK